MSLLSKSEIQFLQGQKQVSKSYQRKLKYVFKKKIEALRYELPLISKIIDIDDIFREVIKTSNQNLANGLDNNQFDRDTDFSNYYPVESGLATDFSNPSNLTPSNRQVPGNKEENLRVIPAIHTREFHFHEATVRPFQSIILITLRI